MHRRAAAGEGGKRKKKTKEKSSASHISIHQVKSRLKNYDESDYSTTLTDCGQTSTANDYRGKMKQSSYGYYGGNTEDKVTLYLYLPAHSGRVSSVKKEVQFLRFLNQVTLPLGQDILTGMSL